MESSIRTSEPWLVSSVVIGKFYPPHAGHHHLIRTASAASKHLTVIVCDAPGENPPAHLRAEWLRRVHPECAVVVTPDDLPNEPMPWAERTIEILGKRPDAVFTSEAYGPGYAKAMGCQHVFVDPDRVTFPISGTAVRADPLAAWSFLEPPARAHYAFRVVVVGAESTGKTTLCRALAEYFQTSWVPEVGREESEVKMVGPIAPVALGDGDIWEPEDFQRIARTQQDRENAFAERCNKILICDTNAVATTIWCERYLGSPDAEVDAIAARDRVNLYLLGGPDLPFVQDGLRDGEHIRDWMHRRFQEVLKNQSAPVVEISGFGEERTARAIAAIEAHL